MDNIFYQDAVATLARKLETSISCIESALSCPLCKMGGNKQLKTIEDVWAALPEEIKKRDPDMAEDVITWLVRHHLISLP